MKRNKVKLFGKNSVFRGFAKHTREENRSWNKQLIKSLNQY